MPFNRPIRVISSVGGSSTLSTGDGKRVIVSAEEPIGHPNGHKLEEGDLWFDTEKGELFVYVDSEWIETKNTETEKILLSNPLTTEDPQNPYNSVDDIIEMPEDYPSPYDRFTQSEVNEFFLHADYWALKEINKLKDQLDKIVDDLYDFETIFTVVPNCGLGVDQTENSVSWSFDMRKLISIENANPAINSIGSVPSQFAAANPTIFVNFNLDMEIMTDATLPLISTTSGPLHQLKWEIKDLSDISDAGPQYNPAYSLLLGGSDTQFSVATPLTIAHVDENVVHGFLISSCDPI